MPASVCYRGFQVCGVKCSAQTQLNLMKATLRYLLQFPESTAEIQSNNPVAESVLAKPNNT